MKEEIEIEIEIHIFDIWYVFENAEDYERINAENEDHALEKFHRRYPDAKVSYTEYRGQLY